MCVYLYKEEGELKREPGDVSNNFLVRECGRLGPVSVSGDKLKDRVCRSYHFGETSSTRSNNDSREGRSSKTQILILILNFYIKVN